jgi:hypothetical protein
MCHYDHIRLNPSERKEVARWTGLMIPIYASIAVLVLAALVITHQPRTGEMIAAAPVSNSNLVVR